MRTLSILNELIELVGQQAWDEACAGAWAGNDGGEVPHEIAAAIWSSDRAVEAAFGLFRRVFERMPCYGNLMYLGQSLSTHGPALQRLVLPWIVEVLDSASSQEKDALRYWLWRDVFEGSEQGEPMWAFIRDNAPWRVMKELLPSTGPVPWRDKAPMIMRAAGLVEDQEAALDSLVGAAFDVYGRVQRVEARAMLEGMELDEEDERVRTLRARLALFPVQAYDYHTGVCADGRQVVMGLLCPALVAFFFDQHGHLLCCEQRPWSEEATALAGEQPPFQIFGETFQALIAAQEEAWQQELGFIASTIHVREFFDEQRGVGIERLPGHLEMEEIETEEDPQEQRELLALREEWLATGAFVWWWARDYYMSGDGEVEST